MISMMHSPISSSQPNNNEKKLPDEKKSKKPAKPELIFLDDDEDDVDQNRHDGNDCSKENKDLGKKSTNIIKNDSILKSYHQPKKSEASSVKVTPFTKKTGFDPSLLSSSSSRHSGSVITSTSTITNHIDSQESPDVTPSKNIKNLIESPILNKGLNRLMKKSKFASSHNNNEDDSDDDAPEIITNDNIPDNEIPRSNSVIKENSCTTDNDVGSTSKLFSNLSSYSGSSRTIMMLSAAAKLASSNGNNYQKLAPSKSTFKNKSSSPLPRSSIIQSPINSRGAAFLNALGKQMEFPNKTESTSKSREVSSADLNDKNNSTPVITSKEKLLNGSSNHPLSSISSCENESLVSILKDGSVNNSEKNKFVFTEPVVSDTAYNDTSGVKLTPVSLHDDNEPLISNSESIASVDSEQTPPRKFKRGKLNLSEENQEENAQCSYRAKIIRLDSEKIDDDNPSIKIPSRQTSKSNRNLFNNDIIEENLKNSAEHQNDSTFPGESEPNTNNQRLKSKVSSNDKNTVSDFEDQTESDDYSSDDSSDVEVVFSSISKKYQCGDDPNCSLYIKDVSNKQIEDVSKEWVQCVEFVQSSSEDDCQNLSKKKKQKRKSKFSVRDVSQTINDSDSSDENGVEVLPVIDHPSSPEQSQQKVTKIIDLAEISVEDDDDEDHGNKKDSKNDGKMSENVNVPPGSSLQENIDQSNEKEFLSPEMFDNFEPFPKSQTPVCLQKFQQSDDGSGLIIRDLDTDSPVIVSPIGKVIKDDENLDDTITLFSECSSSKESFQQSSISVSDEQINDATPLTTSIDPVAKPISSSQESTEQLIEISDRSDDSSPLDSKAETRPNKSILRPPSFELNVSSKKKRVIFSEPVVSCELVFDSSAPTPENPENDLSFKWLPSGIKKFDSNTDKDSEEIQQKATTIDSNIRSSLKRTHENGNFSDGTSSSLTQKRRKLCHQNATLDDHDHDGGDEKTKNVDVSDLSDCSTQKSSNGIIDHKLLSLIEASDDEDEDDVYFSLSQLGNEDVFEFGSKINPEQNSESNPGEESVSSTVKITSTKDCSSTEKDSGKQSIDAVSNIDQSSATTPTNSSLDSMFQVYTQNQFQKREVNNQEETTSLEDILRDSLCDVSVKKDNKNNESPGSPPLSISDQNSNKRLDIEKNESSEQNQKNSEEPEMLTIQIPLKLAKEFYHYLGKYIQSYESNKVGKS